MKIEILTDKGMPISLVRFFMLDMKQFLIFLNNNEGADAQGHITIHVSEIVNAGHVTANAVSDADWENIKNIIKGIVGANKNNQPLPVQDMDYNVIDGVSIVGDRALKLMSNYVDLLQANQPIFEKTIVEDIIKPTQEVSNAFESTNISSVNDFNANLNVETPNRDVQENTFEVPSTEAPVAPAPVEPVVETPAPAQIFENNSSNNGFESVQTFNDTPGINYEQLYNEQVQLVNSLQNELTEYKNKIETLKNIINN